MLSNFLDLFTIFLQGSLAKHIFISKSTQTPRNLYFWYTLHFQRTHSLFNLIFRAGASLQRTAVDIFQEMLFFILATSRSLVVKVAPFEWRHHMISQEIFIWFNLLIVKQSKLVYAMPGTFHNGWFKQ